MVGRISQSFIDELIARADIVELIGSRVPLRRAGHEYKACCPFHDEKTPSFSVSPAKQFYHCFGCGAHGTALGFLMQFDRLSFPEAVEELATRLALTVVHEAGARSTAGAVGPGDHGSMTDPDSLKSLYELLAQVADHYRANLARHAHARAYAAERGLTPAIIERFGIGYAAPGWSDLLRRLGSDETARLELSRAGLIIERDVATETVAVTRGLPKPGYYDRFRDRLMFPIRDTRGRVVGFGGRVLAEGQPKYLNSPETALFHKGKELYGLFETRLARQTLKRLLIVEGYMDVVRLHQHGLTYAVATLGTATTPEHLRRAFRLVSELVFCFDADRAGRAAAWRALQTALPEARAGREMRFLFLPDGEDPDSLVGKEGGERFEARLATALPLSEYLVAHLAEEADISHTDGKARFIALARPLLDKIEAGVYRELLLERLATALSLPLERLQQWLAGASAPRPPQQRVPPRLARASAGRGSLVAQAITLLLHFPTSAGSVSDAQREALQGLAHPGAGVLAQLLAQQTTAPAASMAQTLERWRERDEYRRLCELAASAPLVPDAAAAARELSEAVKRLLDREVRSRRLDTLIQKARVEHLDSAEKLELQALTADQSAGTAAPSGPTAASSVT